MNKRIEKVFMFLSLLAATLVFLMPLWAREIITNRTGTIKITRLDGTTLIVDKDDPLPDIPSGSMVEILDGSMDVAPTEGFIQVVLGDSVATVKASDKVIASVDPETGMADFKTKSGQISVVTGNTTARVKADQEALFNLDRATDEV